MGIIEIMREPIEAEMKEFNKRFDESLQSDNPLLNSINQYILQKKGKQLRPIIGLLSAKLCGQCNQAAIDGAVSIELLHTASLVHDDVVDDAVERRGHTSVNAEWDKKIAVLVGDFLLSKSLVHATETNNLEILKVIANLGVQLADGELLQMSNTNRPDTSEEDYFNVIRKKTAALFAFCAQVGALAANASEDICKHLWHYGEYLGICFQIKDDIFDYSKNKKLGKPTGNDIREGKVTLPLIYALRNSKSKKRDVIAKWIEEKKLGDKQIEEITTFAHEEGGIEYATQQMEIYKDKAIAVLATFPDNNVKEALITCAELTVKRDF